MATFLYKTALGLLLLQTPASDSPPRPQQDSLRASVWARILADSTDASAWLDFGRYYLQRSAEYHAHKTRVDSAWAHATLDSAQLAFDRAARLSPGTRTADSARVFRVAPDPYRRR